MKTNIVKLAGLLVGIVLVGALVVLLFTPIVSRPSQTGGQPQQAEPSTSEPTATSKLAALLTDMPAVTPDLSARLTPTPTATSDLAAPLTTIPTITVPDSSRFYLYSEEVNAIEGRLVAQRESPYPDVFPNFRLESYRFTELDLPKPIPVTIDGTPAQISVVWRLTVTGGPFTIASLPWMIWLDDVSLGPGIGYGTSRISVIIVNKSLLHNGSTIFVSYGGNGVRNSVAKLELNR